MFEEAQPHPVDAESERRATKAEEPPAARAGRGKAKSKTLRPGLY